MKLFESLNEQELKSIALFDNAYHVYREAMDLRRECITPYIRERLINNGAHALKMLEIQQGILGYNPRAVLSLSDYDKAVAKGLNVLGVIV